MELFSHSSLLIPADINERKHSCNQLSYSYKLSDGYTEFNNLILFIEINKIKFSEKASICLNAISKLWKNRNKKLDHYMNILNYHEYISDFIYMSNNIILKDLWEKYTFASYKYRNFIKSLQNEKSVSSLEINNFTTFLRYPKNIILGVLNIRK